MMRTRLRNHSACVRVRRPRPPSRTHFQQSLRVHLWLMRCWMQHHCTILYRIDCARNAHTCKHHHRAHRRICALNTHLSVCVMCMHLREHSPRAHSEFEMCSSTFCPPQMDQHTPHRHHPRHHPECITETLRDVRRLCGCNRTVSDTSTHPIPYAAR